MVIPDESKQLLLRTEIFNLLNRANDYNPISALNLDGVTLNQEFGKVQSAHDLRQIRLVDRPVSWL
jgi:hypothetical protein